MVVLFVVFAVVVLGLGIVDRVRSGGAHRSRRSTPPWFYDNTTGGSGADTTGGWSGGDGGGCSGGDGGGGGSC